MTKLLADIKEAVLGNAGRVEPPEKEKEFEAACINYFNARLKHESLSEQANSGTTLSESARQELQNSEKSRNEMGSHLKSALPAEIAARTEECSAFINKAYLAYKETHSYDFSTQRVQEKEAPTYDSLKQELISKNKFNELYEGFKEEKGSFASPIHANPKDALETRVSNALKSINSDTPENIAQIIEGMGKDFEAEKAQGKGATFSRTNSTSSFISTASNTSFNSTDSDRSSNAKGSEHRQTAINTARLEGSLFTKGLNKDLEQANEAVEAAKEAPSFGTRAANALGAGWSKVASVWKGSRKAEMDHLEAAESRSQAEIAAAEAKRDAVAVKKAGVDASQGYIEARQDLRASTDHALEDLKKDKSLSPNEYNKARLAILKEHELAKTQLEKSQKATLKAAIDDITVRRNPQLDKCTSYEDAEKEMKKSTAPAFTVAEEKKVGGNNVVQVLDDPRYPKDQTKSPYKDLAPEAYQAARQAHQLTLTTDKTGKVTEVEAGKDASFTMLCNGQMITKRGGQIESKFGDPKDTPVIMVDKKDVTDFVKFTSGKSAAGLQSSLEKMASSKSGVDSGVNAKAPAKGVAVHL